LKSHENKNPMEYYVHAFTFLTSYYSYDRFHLNYVPLQFFEVFEALSKIAFPKHSANL